VAAGLEIVVRPANDLLHGDGFTPRDDQRGKLGGSRQSVEAYFQEFDRFLGYGATVLRGGGFEAVVEIGG